jgi:hypothetical protein
MRKVRSSVFKFSVLMTLIVALNFVFVATSDALWSSSRSSAVQTFSGASFSPVVAPSISSTVGDGKITLTWPSVTLSGGQLVNYSVMRTPSTGPAVEVCTGANAPVQNGGVSTCSDTTAVSGMTYSYTEQPIARSGVTPTWTLPASTSSVAVAPKSWVFDSAGSPTISNNNNAQLVSYPTGTVQDDALVLVSVSDRNAAPTLPSGWTQLSSSGMSSPSPMYFYVAWRRADAGSSVSFRSGTNSQGALTLIYRYKRLSGNTSAPVIAHVAVQSSNSASSSGFTPPSNVTTNLPGANALSIVAISSDATLSLQTNQNYVFRNTSSATSANAALGLSIGLGDKFIQSSGSAGASPTWAQSGATTQWMSVAIALA